eukprot:GHVR01090645.1.p1 GENE.GHVR01090645.1~~GHVR01090645.1.p1  ORF type:complete len:106 (+),score=59.60 GHVR01090645.1:99-416(+)
MNTHTHTHTHPVCDNIGYFQIWDYKCGDILWQTDFTVVEYAVLCLGGSQQLSGANEDATEGLIAFTSVDGVVRVFSIRSGSLHWTFKLLRPGDEYTHTHTHTPCM